MIVDKIIFQSENLFEAIDGNNYELAFNLCESYNVKNNINSSESILSLLLKDICYLVKKYSISDKKKVDVIEDKSVVDVKEILDDKSISTSTNLSMDITFSDVIGLLMKSDLENAFRILRNYLKSINKKEYEFLIVDLIKISLIEKDIAFTKPMIALTYISRENFKFDISNYIQEFYITLSQNRFDKARIYLDIISNSNKLGLCCVLTDGLLQVLNNAESVIDCKKNNSVLNSVENSLKKSQKVISDTKSISVPIETIQSVEQEQLSNSPASDLVFEQNPRLSRKEKNTTSVETKDSEKEFLENKHEMLINGQGMILLRPMDNERRKRIHEMVKEYRDMVSFSIGEGQNRQVVLRYKPILNEYVNLKSLIKTGDIAYKEGNYDLCIENYLQLLQFGTPKVFVYAKLGLAYMKKWNKEKAIDYLTIATHLSKQEDGQYDFTELIGSLKGLIIEEDKKPRFRMAMKDFENDTQYYYGIENFDKIELLVLEYDLDVESASKKLNMTDEEINIVKLIYAKQFYSQGDYGKGDQFLNSVEKSKNKTKNILKLLQEIRTNKKFYVNRASEDAKKLSLKIQPTKIK